MKKVSIILLAVIVAAALMMIPVFATTGGVAASEVAGIVGKTTDIYISVHGFADVESLAVEYQIPEGLTLESASWIPKGNLQDVNLESRRAVWTTKNPLDMIQSTQVLKMTVRVENSALDPQDLTKTIALRVMVDSASQGRKEFSLQANVRILVPAQAVTLDQQMLYMDLVKAPQATLVATVSPDYTTDTLRWSSDNEDVVRVENGELTAIGVGIANITVTAGDVSAVCQVTVTCSHTGGTATCTQKAECEYCHETYGQYGAHTQEPHWVQYQETHVQVYGCCNALASEEELHQWDDGACSGCGATCLHEGGQATCTEKAKCDKCDEYYGQFNDVHTGQAEWVQTATKHSKIYGCCGMVEVEEAPHNWSGDTCLDCAYVCQHTGGKATCTEQATCTICGERYGNLDADNHVGQAKWMMNAEKHSQVYDCCSYVSVEEAGHRWEDGICADCNFGCSHAGSEATCVKPAVCTTCGKEHAQIDPNNHKQTEIRGQKPGGCLEDGYTGDVYCLDCEKMIGEGQTIPAVGHHEDADGQWERDKDAHFYTCVCGEVFDRASHTGGKATCTQAAICEECGASYGDLDTEGHIGGEATCSEAAICEKCGEHYGELNAANHIGGKATCTSKAICTGCGVSYGKIDPHNHTGATKWIKTETKHSQIFDCCGLELVKATNHIWKEGICVKCLYRCQHTGGEATCVDQAVCTLCDMAYGDVNAENHTGEAQWALSETKHSQTYDCCGLEVVKEAAHTWEVGICTICQYTCQHTGGEATCVDQAVCTLCGMAYGDVNAENHTGEAKWALSETKHSQTYDCCGLEVVKEAAHTWEAGICTICRYTCQHTGGEATCVDQAVCTLCGMAYGDVNAENHTGEAQWALSETMHSQTYDCCGLEVVKEAAHTWEVGICTICQYTCQHTGGEATCVDQAVCTLCDMAYGDVNAENHTGEAQWTLSETMHSLAYPCCGLEVVKETTHVWKDSVCVSCQYACQHTGGEATCNQKAICDICAATYGDLNAENHTEEAVWVQTATQHSKVYPCCDREAEAAALHTWKDGGCQNCGYACQHDQETELRGAYAETCYMPGYSGDVYCKICGHLVESGKEIPANEKHVASTAWFHNDTHHWHICTVAGCEAIVAQTEHSFQWVVDQMPTEMNVGWKHEMCTDCGYEKEKVEIPVVTHQHTNVVHHAAQEATCVASGNLSYYTCESAYCAGKYYADEACVLELETIVVPADPDRHVGQSQLQGALEATCGKDGYSGDLYCLSCNGVISQGVVIPATGLHTAGQTYQTSASHHWLSCIDCGAALESQAHTLSWIVDQNPTEDELGKKHALCAVCGFEDEAVSIDKIPHIPAFELGQKATCTEDGVADHYFCENCGRYFASENGGIGAQIQEEQLVVKATGHQYGETWQSDENGHWLVCHCGHKDQSNAHNGVLVGAVEATKEHDGYTGDLVCDICGYEMQKGQRIPSQAQNKVDEILAAQPGDLVNVGLVNEAGQVDTQILGQVLQAAAGKDVTLMLDAGDYQWTISGLQISAAELHTVDLKVQTNTQNIPADTVESLAGTAPTIQFAVGRMEAFGFLANLMTRVDAQYANAQYSLYAYGADGKLVQVQAGKIDADGNLTASLSSGGDYLLVIDLDSPPTGDNGIGLILACMACAMAVVVIIKAKKRLF